MSGADMPIIAVCENKEEAAPAGGLFLHAGMKSRPQVTPEPTGRSNLGQDYAAGEA